MGVLVTAFDGFGTGVIPVLIGPLQVLLAILPGILVALGAGLVSLFRPRVMLAGLKLAWRLKFHLAAAAVVAMGVGWGVKRIARAVRPGTSVAHVAGSDWTMFRGSAVRTGGVPGREGDAVGPCAGAVNWEWRKKDLTFYASPTVVGNRVYVSSTEGIGPFDREGVGGIYCFDADSGAEVWHCQPRFASGARAYRATFASPVVKGRYLVCGEGLHTTPNCRVICLDIGDEKNVRLLWSHATSNHVECTPIIGEVKLGGNGTAAGVEDRVFVGAGDTGGYYCFALATGELRWRLSGPNYLDAETALVYADNRVYAGLGNDGKALCAVDAADGRELARVATPYPVFSPPAVADGSLYVGMGNGDFINKASDLGLKPVGELWAVDLGSLESAASAARGPVWKVQVEDTILSSVAVEGCDVFCATANGVVYRVDRQSGSVMAKWTGHNSIKASPAVTRERVYVVTVSGTVYGLERRDLRPVWECRVSGGEQNFSSPAVVGGRVIVGTERNGLVCAGAVSTGPSVWPGRLAGPAKGGNFQRGDAPRAGVFAWNFPASASGDRPTAFMTAPVAATGGRIFVPVAVSPGPGVDPGIVCLPDKWGNDAPQPLWAVRTAPGVFLSPAVVDGRVFAVTGAAGDAGRKLMALAAEDGATLWSAEVGRDAGGVVTACEDGLVVADDQPGRAACYGLDGRNRWTASVPGRVRHGAAWTASFVVLVTEEPAALLALDRQTGAVLLRKEMERPATATPAADGATVYVGTSRGVEARSLIDGGLVPGWSLAGGGVGGDFAMDERRVVYVSDRNELVILDRARGLPVTDPIPAAAGTAPLPCRSRVLFLDPKFRIQSVEIGSSGTGAGEAIAAFKPVVWLADTSDLGSAPCAPMVLCASGIVVPWTGWGLLALKLAE